MSGVVRHSYGFKNLTPERNMSNGYGARKAFNNMAITESLNTIEKETEIIEKNDKFQQRRDTIVQKSLESSQLMKINNEIYSTGKELIFKEIMFEMFSKSLFLDQDFILTKESVLRGLTDSYVDGKGGYKLLTESYNRTKSPFLKKIIKICEATASKVAKRKLNEKPETMKYIKFDLNDEEKDEFNRSKEDLNVEQLADLVKKKVLTVVQDEKTRQAKEDELMSDLEEEAGEEVTNENMHKYKLDYNPVEEATLFNAITRNSLKDMITTLSESVHQHFHNYDDDDVDDTSDFYNINADVDDVAGSEFQGDMTAREENENHETVESDIDMDLVLAESITKYTLMELNYTTQLESYDREKVRKVSERLLLA